MKIVLSINNKFFKVKPEELINLIKVFDIDNQICGMEVMVLSSEDMDYAKELAKCCVYQNLIFRLHAPTFASVNEYFDYLDFVNEISIICGYDINVVFHSIYDEDVVNSVNKTEDYVDKMLKYLVDKSYKNIVISIENLNNRCGFKRLKNGDLEGVLVKNIDLKFTYDIGHELIDGDLNPELSDILFDRINNIHVHVFNGKEDHYPIIDEDEKAILVIESMKKLINCGYNGVCVTEYALDYIEDDSFLGKLKKYVEYSSWFGNLLNVNSNLFTN